jgi:hypothetical protein
MILPSQLTRRQTLQLLGMSGIGYLLGSCSDSNLAESVGNFTEPLNQPFEELLVKPQLLIPEYPISSIDPQALLINTYDETPNRDARGFGKSRVMNGLGGFNLDIFEFSAIGKLKLRLLSSTISPLRYWVKIHSPASF